MAWKHTKPPYVHAPNPYRVEKWRRNCSITTPHWVVPLSLCLSRKCICPVANKPTNRYLIKSYLYIKLCYPINGTYLLWLMNYSSQKKPKKKKGYTKLWKHFKTDSSHLKWLLLAGLNHYEVKVKMIIYSHHNSQVCFTMMNKINMMWFSYKYIKKILHSF